MVAMAGRAAERMLRAIGGSGYEDDEDLLLLNGRTQRLAVEQAQGTGAAVCL